jgi:hypothetical protein
VFKLSGPLSAKRGLVSYSLDQITMKINQSNPGTAASVL